ncbi:NAD-dependent dehydratase [Blastomonas sp. AAP25]|uniref:NAD(P)H-binding protein n=1 Tax=Blastomonas sp. AAP25 TaxID=1523416 RepID=UPI0006B8B8ED|nr:NAD(P)H-binding protein [Blastomonas sp. AAP25]KPF76906.1 NAD-dependent dehydratase [Blastomonas sp. AAP25]
MTTLLIAGATGLVGRIVLAKALDDPRIGQVISPTRSALPTSPRLTNPIVDYDALPQDADWWRCDAVICALGTTRAKAGSDAAFFRVDHDYPLAVAQAARAQGAQAFALVSAIGADAGSRLLYNRTKGEVEASIAALDFPSYTIVRPGLIGGDRDEFRPAERVSEAILRVFGPVLPRGWRISPAENIASALIEAAVAAPPGRHVISADRLA